MTADINARGREHEPPSPTLWSGILLALRNPLTVIGAFICLAMLVAARENDCQYIWNAHAPPARAVGLRDDIVDALREKKELPSPAADEAAVINYGREFFRTRVGRPMGIFEGSHRVGRVEK